MTDTKLASLFSAFAQFYWSVPVSYAVQRIKNWYPDVSDEQISAVLEQIKADLFWQHCSIETEGLAEPELVAEHLTAFGGDDFEQFLKVRISSPYCAYDEETISSDRHAVYKRPEAMQILQFGEQELGLDRAWAEQLTDDCLLSQPIALCDGISWVMSVLQQEQFGQIHFQTVDQVRQFRTLGNKLYQVTPNPVLRGWKPAEIENAPVLPDEIPASDKEIPDHRQEMKRMISLLREKIGMEEPGAFPTDEPFDTPPAVSRNRNTGESESNPLLVRKPSDARPKVSANRKIGRNDPCPCGSGKKYKKCCGRERT